MKLINITPTDDPTRIAHIDMNKSIIMCVTENNNNIEVDEKTIYLKNPSDISFNSQKILPNNFTAITYSPNIRWCFPNDINIIFREAFNSKKKSYFSTIYISNSFHIKGEKNTLIDYSFSLFIDRSRSKEMGKIRKNEQLIEVNFEYKMFSEIVIENVYIIKNNYCFKEFETHFSF